MLEELIENILQYCPLSLSIFLVNKTFERIYTKIIYNLDLSNKLFKIACYEKDNDKINMLIRKQLITLDNKKEKLLQYWKAIDYSSKSEFKINWDTLFKSEFQILIKFVDYKVDNGYNDIKVSEKDSHFGYKMLNHFYLMKDRFVSKSDHEWIYKKYYTINFINVNHCEFVFFLDHESNKFFIIASTYGHPEIYCNIFSYFNSDSSPNMRIVRNQNPTLDELIDDSIKYYNSCMKLYDYI